PFAFEILVPIGGEEYALLAAFLKESLQKLMITVTIQALDWDTYLVRSQEGQFHACISGWDLGLDPDPFDMFHSSQIAAGNNYVAYKNETVDRLLEEGRREFERQKRQQIYWQVHKILHRDQPYLFAYTSMEIFILSSRIKNYKVSPYGLFEFFPGQLSWTLQ
ncbi:hypothetical protein ACFL27_04090, partial [candidate division CSSED10-310 bacterium]